MHVPSIGQTLRRHRLYSGIGPHRAGNDDMLCHGIGAGLIIKMSVNDSLDIRTNWICSAAYRFLSCVEGETLYTLERDSLWGHDGNYWAYAG